VKPEHGANAGDADFQSECRNACRICHWWDAGTGILRHNVIQACNLRASTKFNIVTDTNDKSSTANARSGLIKLTNGKFH